MYIELMIKKMKTSFVFLVNIIEKIDKKDEFQD